MTVPSIRPAPALATVLAVLLVAAAALAALHARAAARDADGDAGVAAVRTHLADVTAAAGGADPAALARARDGATGPWRATLDRAATAGADAARPGTVAVRAAGLESYDDETARVLVHAELGGSTVPRDRRVAATIRRVDDRWLVADLAEIR